MESLKFVEAYSRTLPVYNNIQEGALLSEDERSVQWNHTFGKALYESLRNGEQHQLSLEVAGGYDIWNAKRFEKDNDLFAIPIDRLMIRSRDNFHVLNRGMLPLWRPIIEGAWPRNHQRSYQIRYCIEKLAVEGYTGFMMRQSYIEENGGVTFLQKGDAKKRNEVATGALQECDAAIVTMQALLRHDKLQSATVVPAPLQFEKTDKSTNIDLVVADIVGKRAVGLQVRTNVDQQMIDQSDRDRVVYIDGTIDLGNVTLARLQEGKSKESLIAWPGIIATKIISEMQTQGSKKSPFLSEIKRTLGTRRAAHRLLQIKDMQRDALRNVGDLRVDFDKLAKIIGDRIAEKL